MPDEAEEFDSRHTMEHLGWKIAEEKRRPHEVGAQTYEQDWTGSLETVEFADVKDDGCQHKNNNHVVYEHGDKTGKTTYEGYKQWDVPFGPVQGAVSKIFGNTCFTEVPGDQPDAYQDHEDVPVDELEGLDLGHAPCHHHGNDADQGRDHSVDLAYDDENDRDRENHDCSDLDGFHKTPLAMMK